MRLVYAVKSGFLNYVNFRTRSARSSYWYWQLFVIILNLITYNNDWLGSLVSGVMLFPSLAVAVRRMHDVDRKGWWMFVPVYNIYLACLPGTTGENRFGPPEPPLTFD